MTTSFLSNFGRLPGTWINLVIIVVSGLAEGVGLAMFVPLLEFMGEPGKEHSWIFSGMESVLASIGIPFSIVSLLVVIVILIVGALSLILLQRWYLARSQFAFLQTLRESLTTSLFMSGWPHMSEQSHGNVVNQMVTESHRASGALQFQILFLGSLIQAAIYLAISSFLSWELLIFSIIFTALVAVLIKPLVTRSNRLGQEQSIANKDYSFHIIDFLKGSKLIKATASEPAIINRLCGFNDILCDIIKRAQVNQQLTYFLVQAIPVFILALAIGIAHEVLHLSTSFTLVFLLILVRVAPRLIQSQQHYQNYVAAVPGLHSVDQMVAKAKAAQEEMNPKGRALGALESSLSLDGVFFRYPSKDLQAIDNISFTVKCRKMIAIVGGSGAGKSTVVDLITSLQRPDSGQVLVDGSDLKLFDLASWRQRIGYVTQDVMVFNDTIRNNLTFGAPGVDESYLTECLRIAHLTETIESLPEGLETIVGESGVRLSGGQKQRLALARALVGKPELLILDEATSSLDNESERIIQSAIEEISHKMTIIVVAHRLSTIRKADLIIVMENGRVIETGRYDDLVKRQGRFAKLHDMQF